MQLRPPLLTKPPGRRQHVTPSRTAQAICIDPRILARHFGHETTITAILKAYRQLARDYQQHDEKDDA